MKELHLLKNLESDIVFVMELMGNFIGGGNSEKRLLFDISGPKEEIYASVTIKFLESLQNFKPPQKPVPINKNLVWNQIKGANSCWTYRPLGVCWCCGLTPPSAYWWTSPRWFLISDWRPGAGRWASLRRSNYPACSTFGSSVSLSCK